MNRNSKRFLLLPWFERTPIPIVKRQKREKKAFPQKTHPFSLLLQPFSQLPKTTKKASFETPSPLSGVPQTHEGTVPVLHAGVDAETFSLVQPEGPLLQKTGVSSGPLSELPLQDFLSPSDALKKSMEGFLLDLRSAHTRVAYGKDLKRFIRFLLVRQDEQKRQPSASSNSSLALINRTLLIQYKETLLREKLQHTTVDRHLATLRSFFQWLVDDGWITRNPAEGVRFLNPKKLSSTRGFSDEEVRRVLSMPNLHTRSGAMHYAILMMLFFCGLRRSELCALKTNHLRLEKGQHVICFPGKGNQERLLVLIPSVWNALEHYFKINRRSIEEEAFLFQPQRNHSTKILQKPLNPSSIFYLVRLYSRRAGISAKVSPHSCRATAISNARDHQVPDRAIQEFAGWSSPTMITRYDKRREVLEKSAGFSIDYGSQ